MPLNENDMSTEVAWEQFYHGLDEFSDVPFSQFKEHLREHREKLAQKLSARLANSYNEEKALEHDRILYPRKNHNHRGERVFDLSPAKKCLREDVKNKVHLVMSPSELQASRPEYAGFKRNKFKDRVHQEVRRQKFTFYLELQREKKLKEKLKGCEKKLKGRERKGRGPAENNMDNMDES